MLSTVQNTSNNAVVISASRSFPQKRCQHLVEQKQREHIFDRVQIFPRQREQRLIRAEEGQNRTLKAQNSDPCQKDSASAPPTGI